MAPNRLNLANAVCFAAAAFLQFARQESDESRIGTAAKAIRRCIELSLAALQLRAASEASTDFVSPWKLIGDACTLVYKILPSCFEPEAAVIAHGEHVTVESMATVKRLCDAASGEQVTLIDQAFQKSLLSLNAKYTRLPSSHFLQARFNILASEGLVGAGAAAPIVYARAVLAIRQAQTSNKPGRMNTESNLWISFASALWRCATSLREVVGASAGCISAQIASRIGVGYTSLARSCAVWAIRMAPSKVEEHSSIYRLILHHAHCGSFVRLKHGMLWE